MFLKPKKGLRVINPKTKKPIHEDGEEIELSSYWRKRISDGDFEENKIEEVVISNDSKENKKESKKDNKQKTEGV